MVSVIYNAEKDCWELDSHRVRINIGDSTFQVIAEKLNLMYLSDIPDNGRYGFVDRFVIQSADGREIDKVTRYTAELEQSPNSFEFMESNQITLCFDLLIPIRSPDPHLDKQICKWVPMKDYLANKFMFN